MTTFSVYHQKFNRISGVPEGYVEVAQIDVPLELRSIEDQLEYCFRWTQNLDDSWSIKDQEHHDNNDNVRVIAPLEDGYGHRSSMVGDLFRITGTGFIHECAMCGWEIADNKFGDL